LAAVGACVVQFAAGWSMTLLVVQVMPCQPLPADAVCGVQEATGTLVALFGVQIVAV